MAEQTANRQRALELIRRYGWNNTSFQTLEPYFEYWFDPEAAGMVAYYRAWGTWVAAGAPVCSHERIGACAMGFAKAARRSRHRACFFGTLERFAAELGTEAASIKIGEQPWWDPQRWDMRADRRRSVGSQLRRAKRHGVIVRQIPAAEMADENSEPRRAAQGVIDAWQKTHRMATMSFVVQLDAFSFPEQRRYFLAEKTGADATNTAVGFLAMIPIYARDGWFLEDLVRTADAPNGTAEALVDAAMRAVAAEGAAYATLGLSPLRQTSSSQFAQPRWAAWIFATSRRLLDPLYSFEGLAAFKTKFRPDGWEEVYLTGIPRVTPLMLVSVLAAFARSRPASFAGATLARLAVRTLRRTRPVTWRRLAFAFAVTLVAWIALLAQADSRYWFGSAAMRDIWIAFDCVMVVLFMILGWGAGRRHAFVGPLALFAAGAVAADLFLTAGQALAFHLEHAEWQLRDTLTWLVALSGPALATLFLTALATVQARHAQRS
ncbi:MAG: phosphatidylglycerol lysyltransferase domain-containing protein [Aureliella sp.]